MLEESCRTLLDVGWCNAMDLSQNWMIGDRHPREHRSTCKTDSSCLPCDMRSLRQANIF